MIEEGVELDLKEITIQLEKNRKTYEQGDSVKIKFYQLGKGESPDNLDPQQKFLGTISDGKFKYVGTLNVNLQRSHMGLNIYQNGDIYLGDWKDNIKHKHGVYLHKPEKEEIQIYSGYWLEGTKNGKGMYMWSKSSSFDGPYDSVSFDTFIGQFESGYYKICLYLSQTVDENTTQYAYLGNFTPDGKKNDRNAFYYLVSEKKLFYGKIENDNLQNGFIFNTESDGSIVNVFKFDKNQEGELIFTNEDKISEEDRKRVTLDAEAFLRMYHGYKFYENTYNSMRDLLYQTRIFQDMNTYEKPDEYPKLMKDYVAYNDFYKIVFPKK